VTETGKWLARHRRRIGRHPTVDLARHFLAERPEQGSSPGDASAPEVVT